MAKSLRPRNGAQKKDSGKPVQKSTQIEVYVPLIVSVGNDNRAVLHPEWVAKVVAGIKKECPEARITPTGGYYLIDGKVCLVQDYDPVAMDRKPGTFPPSWAAQGDEKKQAILAERAAELAKNPPKNQLGVQPPNLLTSKETEEVVQSRKKLRPSPKPKQEEIAPEPLKRRRASKPLRRKG